MKTRDNTPDQQPPRSPKGKGEPQRNTTRATSEEPTGQEGKPSEEEVISNWSQPRTNQDEQDKITNAEQGDIPMADK